MVVIGFQTFMCTVNYCLGNISYRSACWCYITEGNTICWENIMLQYTVSVPFDQTPNEISRAIVHPSFPFLHACIVGITLPDCVCCGMKKKLNIGVVIEYLLGGYFRALCQQKANEPENLAPLHTLSLHTSPLNSLHLVPFTQNPLRQACLKSYDNG